MSEPPNKKRLIRVEETKSFVNLLNNDLITHLSKFLVISESQLFVSTLKLRNKDYYLIMYEVIKNYNKTRTATDFKIEHLIMPSKKEDSKYCYIIMQSFISIGYLMSTFKLCDDLYNSDFINPKIRNLISKHEVFIDYIPNGFYKRYLEIKNVNELIESKSNAKLIEIMKDIEAPIDTSKPEINQIYHLVRKVQFDLSIDSLQSIVHLIRFNSIPEASAGESYPYRILDRNFTTTVGLCIKLNPELKKEITLDFIKSLPPSSSTIIELIYHNQAIIDRDLMLFAIEKNLGNTLYYIILSGKVPLEPLFMTNAMKKNFKFVQMLAEHKCPCDLDFVLEASRTVPMALAILELVKANIRLHANILSIFVPHVNKHSNKLADALLDAGYLVNYDSLLLAIKCNNDYVFDKYLTKFIQQGNRISVVILYDAIKFEAVDIVKKILDRNPNIEVNDTLINAISIKCNRDIYMDIYKYFLNVKKNMQLADKFIKSTALMVIHAGHIRLLEELISLSKVNANDMEHLHKELIMQNGSKSLQIVYKKMLDNFKKSEQAPP
jgi:hypothetical protein